MKNNLEHIQIILTGKFTPLSADPLNLLEISTLFQEFHLFPKEVMEQRIEFDPNGQKVTLIKSLELVSPNQLSALQVRSDMLVYETNTNDLLDDVFSTFIKILTKVEKKINFDKVSRLGIIQTKQEIEESILTYKKDNNLSSEIIEHRNRVVLRKKIESISELINFVKTSDYISKEAGAPQNILNYSYDVNTLSDKDAPRFNIIDIKNFLNGASKFLLEG